MAGAGEGFGVGGIKAKDLVVAGEGSGIVVSLGEELRGLELGPGIWRKSGGQGHQLRFSFVGRALLEQKLDEFDAGFAAIGVGSEFHAPYMALW